MYNKQGKKVKKMIRFARYLYGYIPVTKDVHIEIKELKGIYKTVFNVKCHELNDEIPFEIEIDELEDLVKNLRARIQRDIAEQEIKNLKVSSTKPEGEEIGR